ncbi:MAG: hypothetical protein Q9225_006146 [Loekoesia sp. 1 TL-2023]
MEAQLLAIIPIRDSLLRRAISGGATRFAIYQYLPTRTNRELAVFKNSWKAFNDSVYQKALADSRDLPIVEMYRKVESGAITLGQVLQTLDEMLFENLDVTVSGLSWNLLHLGANPAFQSMFRAEVVAKHESCRGVRSEWEKYLLSSTTLLAASILESARLKPITPFTISQATPTTRKVSGYLVPAGTHFVVDAYAINIRNPFWGPDSLAYRPTRFLESKGNEMRYHYWRFGFGPRTCMARHVADLIMRIVLAHLVRNYTLSLIDHGRDWDSNGQAWITLPTTDIRCERITEQTKKSALM